MLDSVGKSTMSLSDELSYHIKSYLIKQKLSTKEAETLSTQFTSIKQALLNSSLKHKFLHKQEELSIELSSKYKKLSQAFPFPSSLSRLPPKHSLKDQYALYKSSRPIKSESKEESKSNPSSSINPLYKKLFDFAMMHLHDEENANALAVACSSIDEIASIINVRLPPKDDRHGQVFDFYLGCDLESKSCMICLDVFEIGQTLKTLFCAHSFHNDCIEYWLSQKIDSKCPVCNRSKNDIDKIVN